MAGCVENKTKQNKEEIMFHTEYQVILCHNVNQALGVLGEYNLKLTQTLRCLSQSKRTSNSPKNY